MKIKEVFFEEIFHPIIGLWKQEYYLEYGNKTHTCIASLRDDFLEIEDVVEIENSDKKYKLWNSMMVFIIYQVLTEKGLQLLERGEKDLLIKQISIADFEDQFLENLRYEGNEKYLEKYKGFKDIENYRAD
jgi:hypothetical protein